jgi:hypothetical protein
MRAAQPRQRPPGRRAGIVSRDWMSAASCADRSDLPWTADPGQVSAWEALVMVAVCQDCSVLADCAYYAMRTAVTAGFWAGKPRDPDAACTVLPGPGWATDPLPGLPDLGGVA